jgi:hypothetical protein
MAVTRPARPRADRPARTPRRRRQRSVRVTVSVSLLSTATALVLLSLPTRSPLWLSLASVSALLLSWAALRMMWTELMQSRRENAADRAAAAKAYQQLFTVRAAEHAEFTTAMTERLAQAHLAQRQLEGLLARHRDRADAAECDLAQARLLLEEMLATQRDPDVVELASWDGQRAAASAVPLRQA